MSDEIVFSGGPDEEDRPREGFFSPAVCALAGFVLAVTGLIGQNVLMVAVVVVFGSQLDSDDGSGYYVAMGAGTALQAVVALVLARWSLGGERWEVNLGRAAVVIGLVGLVAGLATAIGAFVQDGPI